MTMAKPVRHLSDPRPRQMLKPAQLDNLGEALIAMTRELWVLTDRVAVLEAVLETKGALAKEEVDRFQPSLELQASLDKRRAQLVATLESALRGHD
jgi:hypothetical protein